MRLIDADKLREEWLYGGENEHIYDTNDFLNSIDDQPTVDAGWINVKDCLPDDNERVIAYRPDEPQASAYRFCVMWGWSVKVNARTSGKGITHWMPLPEPPKGE